MTQDHRCPRCGCGLRVIEVQLPVYLPVPTHDDPSRQIIAHYETREEVSDCPRCHGAY